MYIKYIDVNKKFKSSVNLEYDLKNEDKIKEYIPTSDLCDVLEYYVSSALENKSSRSTLLVGPYGKGKSYLMLMITYLLGKRENKELFSEVVAKINKINSKLAEMLLKIDKMQLSLLPVIINNNSADDFNNSFMIALFNALKDAKLKTLMPNSTFNEAINIINKWKCENAKNNFNLESYFKNNNTTIQNVEKELKEYKVGALQKFRRIFTDVSHGATFSSYATNDIASLYADVANKIKDYGYSGLFIIYDEFGLFLENQDKDFNNKLNKLQNLAEKCNSSNNDEQMHLCCVTHKDFVLYSKSKETTNSFAKIAERFKTIKFNRSLEENYEILCDALIRKDGYEEIVKKFTNENDKFIKGLIESNILGEKNIDDLIENSFPFNPLSVYALVNISELLGQNERTLFTFLTDSSENTFKYFVRHNSKGLLNIDYIYDYFSDLIKNDEYLNNFDKKVEALTAIIEDSNEIRVIKALAIFKIINDENKFPSTIKNISLVLDLDEVKVSEIVANLINKSYLKQDSITNNVNFSMIIDDNLNKKIEQIVNSKFINIKIEDLLLKIDSHKYFVSNKYNYEYEMTRYFTMTYLKSSVFMQISEPSSLNSYIDGDGLIINLINDNNCLISDLNDKLKYINYHNIILRLINKDIDNNIIEKAKKALTINYILEDKKLDEVERETLKLYYLDLYNDVNKYLEKILNEANLVSIVDESKKLNDMIYDSLTKTYDKTVILINEQINKNNISSVSKKARNNVGDIILQIKENNYSATSPEGTIYKSFIECLDKNKNIILDITNFIKNNKLNNRLKVNSIYKFLKEKPYGMRKGIMPLFLNKVISNLNLGHKAIILFNKNLEIPVTTANIELALLDEKYEFSILEYAVEAYDAIKLLCNDLQVKTSDNLAEMVKNIIAFLHNDFYSCDQIISQTTINDNIINLSEIEIKYKDLLIQNDSNSFSILFNELPSLFNVTITDLPNMILETRKSMEAKAKNYYANLIDFTRNVFKVTDNIKNGFLNILSINNLNNLVLTNNYNHIYETLIKASHNDESVVKMLASVITKSPLSSFNIEKDKQYRELLDNFVKYLENYNKNEEVNEENITLSPLAETLFSNLEETLNEYSDSVSREEKIKILNALIKGVV